MTTHSITKEHQITPSSGLGHALVNTKADLAAVVRAQSDFLRDKIYQPLAATWAGRVVAVPVSAISCLIQAVIILHFFVIFTAVIFANHYGAEEAPVDFEEQRLDQEFNNYILSEEDEEDAEPVHFAATPKPLNLERTNSLMEQLTKEDNGLDNPLEGLPKPKQAKIPQSDLFQGLLNEVDTRENPKPANGNSHNSKAEKLEEFETQFSFLFKKKEAAVELPIVSESLQVIGEKLAAQRAQALKDAQEKRARAAEEQAQKDKKEQQEYNAEAEDIHIKARFERQQQLIKDAKEKTAASTPDSAEIQAKVARVEELTKQAVQEHEPHVLGFVKREVLKLEAEIVQARFLKTQHAKDLNQAMKIITPDKEVVRITSSKPEQS